MELFNIDGFLSTIALKSTLLVSVAALLSVALYRARSELRSAVWRTTFVALAVLPMLTAGFPAAWSIPIEVPHLAPWNASKASAVQPVVPSPSSASVASAQLPATFAPMEAPRDGGAIWPVLWLLGVTVACLRLGVGYLRAHRRVRSAQPVDCELRQQWLADEAARLGLRSRVQLLQSSETETPVAFKLPRPGLLFPVDAELWDAERYRLVLRHELCHLRRGDLASQLTAQLVCCLYWFNPIVWWAARQFAFERERACDDKVLMLGADPAAYAGHLLAIARSQSGLGTTALATAPMVGRSRLEQRLKAIVDFRPLAAGSPLGRLLPAATIFCLGAMVILLRPTWAQDPVEPDGSENRTEEAVLVTEQDELYLWAWPSNLITLDDGSLQVLCRRDPTPAELEARQKMREWLGPTDLPPEIRIVLRSLNYVHAMDAARYLREKGLLSHRGSIQVDQRTNKLIVRETGDKMESVLIAIDNLDVDPDDC